MISWIILSLIIFAAAVWILRLGAKSAKKTTPPRPQPKAQYHAVVIEGGNSACAAALAMQGKPFLSHQAPTFPLPECNQDNCRCHYSHRQDRRDDERRSAYAASYEHIILTTQADRRLHASRRNAIH